MTVTPIPNEPGRFHVSSETEELPWLVDLKAPFGEPKCACAIEHNRTPEHWNCKHIRAAVEYHNSHRHNETKTEAPMPQLQPHAGQQS